MIKLTRVRVLWWRYLIAAAFLLGFPAVAFADKQYPTSIVTATRSPVRLTRCEAWARDWNKTILTAHAWSPNRLFDLGIAFTNSSHKTVTALQLTLVSYDSLNSAIASAFVDTETNRSADGMSLASGTSFELLGPQSWHVKNAHPDRDHVSCEVTSVRFADGSVWWSGPQPTPQPQPTSL